MGFIAEVSQGRDPMLTASATTQSHWAAFQTSRHTWELSPLRTRGLIQPRDLAAFLCQRGILDVRRTSLCSVRWISSQHFHPPDKQQSFSGKMEKAQNTKYN